MEGSGSSSSPLAGEDTPEQAGTEEQIKLKEPLPARHLSPPGGLSPRGLKGWEASP